jgi:hypothetical protein
MLRKLSALFILVLAFVTSFAQDEFMIYGVVQTIDNNVAGTRLKVELVEEYKTIFDNKLEADGQYRLDLQYGKTYIISFTKDGYTPMVFDTKLIMPEGVRQCCYRPMNLSFHLFKPDGENDELFDDSFLTIKYEKQHKGFNYDLDIDYMVQQRIVQSQIFKQNQLEAREGIKVRSDSIQNEKHYLALINQGTQFYNNNQFYAARRLFKEAQKLKPNRQYPHYKLEDIRTELERFESKANLLGVNVDSLIEKELSQVSIKDEMPAYPAYKPLTKEQVEEIFRKDVEKQVIASSETPEEANRTLAMMNEFFDEEFDKVMIADTPEPTTPVETEPTPDVVTREVDLTPPTTPTTPEPEPPIVEVPVVETPTVTTPVEDTTTKVDEIIATTTTPEPEPTKDTSTTVETPVVEAPVIDTPDVVATKEPVVEEPVTYKPSTPKTVKPQPKTLPANTPKVVDYKTYQDSLSKRYPEERTIEITQNSYKKTTRVIMNNGNMIEVYAKVEHSWGATYYYLEEYPTGYQNIGYSAFMNKTKLYEVEEKNGN